MWIHEVGNEVFDDLRGSNSLVGKTFDWYDERLNEWSAVLGGLILTALIYELFEFYFFRIVFFFTEIKACIFLRFHFLCQIASLNFRTLKNECDILAHPLKFTKVDILYERVAERAVQLSIHTRPPSIAIRRTSSTGSTSGFRKLTDSIKFSALVSGNRSATV